MDPNRKTLAGILATTCLVAIGGLVWHFGYIRPREQFLHDVFECVGDDLSDQVYRRCVEKVQQERGR